MIATNIGNCARCGEDHNQISFSPLNNHEKYSHYALCPNTNQPILAWIEGEENLVLATANRLNLLPPTSEELSAMVNEVVEQNQDLVVRVNTGESKVMNRLMGLVMKMCNDRAIPKTVHQALNTAIGPSDD